MSFPAPDAEPSSSPAASRQGISRQPAPQPPAADPFPTPTDAPPARPVAPQPSNPFGRPPVKLARTAGRGLPVGASHQPPVPAPLPERGAGLFFFINLAAATIAVLFTFLIYLKL